eukprot:snap_masked-scaffold_41-processed-gene-0.4-mRNA-1 protein AED:1.00 eAED:1.00 QI:0/0/0/0/1/1/4/0/331
MGGNRLINSSKKTSLKVFKKFIYRDVNEKLILENIISKECFKEWVKTRKGKLENPKCAFRRTIYAHLRGADGRTPFAQDVEVSMLQKLRKVLPSGKPIDPFKPVIGNRKQFKRNKGGGWLPAFQYPYGHHEKTQVYCQSQSQSLSIVKIRNGPENVDDLSSLENFLKISKKEMKQYLEQGKTVSRSFNYSAVAYLVNLMASQSYYLSTKYILPSLEQQYFRKEYPIYHFSLSSLDGRILYADPLFRDFIGSSTNVLELVPSITEFFNARRIFAPVLRRGDSAWLRGTILVDKVRYIFKSHTKPISSDIEDIFFQIEFDIVVKDAALDRILV